VTAGLLARVASTRLLRDERGTSVIELALLAPVLSLVTMGIIDLSSAYARRMELTEAASRTIEKIAAQDFVIPETKPPLAPGPDYSLIVRDAAEGAGVSEDDVEVTRWLECDGVEQTDYNGTCPGAQGRPECELSDPPNDCFPVMARYVQVRINDSAYQPYFKAILSPGGDGSYTLHAEAALRVQ
jgi:Flp pilus assembly pilin Flp